MPHKNFINPRLDKQEENLPPLSNRTNSASKPSRPARDNLGLRFHSRESYSTSAAPALLPNRLKRSNSALSRAPSESATSATGSTEGSAAGSTASSRSKIRKFRALAFDQSPTKVGPIPAAATPTGRTRSGIDPLSIRRRPGTGTVPAANRGQTGSDAEPPLSVRRSAAIASKTQRTEISDSEAEDSLSSDDSLVDLADLLAARKNSFSPEKGSSYMLQTPKKRRGKIIVTSPRIERQSTAAKFKFDLKSLAKDDAVKRKQDETAARVKNLLALPPPLIWPGDVSSGAVTPTGLIDTAKRAELLEEVVNKKLKGTSSDAVDTEEDSNKVDKVLRAIKRTGVEGQEMGWYFFSPVPPANGPPKPFKKAWVSMSWHERILMDEERLTDALEGGMIGNLARMSDGLSEPILHWALERFVLCQDSLLRKSWKDVLMSEPSALKAVLTPETVSAIFGLLGAKAEGLELEDKMTLVPVMENYYFDRERKQSRGYEWAAVESWVSFLGEAAKSDALDKATAEFALAVLFRLAVDGAVAKHLSLFSAVSKAMGILASVWKDEAEWEEVSQRNSLDLFYAIPTAPLLCRLLSTLPSQRRLHNFRRRLAYAYLLRNASIIRKPITSTFSIPSLLDLIVSDQFEVTRHTNYALLTAKVQLLDIALDDGSSLTSPNLSLSHLAIAHLTDGSIAPLKKSEDQKKREEIFNKDIDDLATALRALWTSISEVGAGQVGKLDAREAIEMVRCRLLFTVRTKSVGRLRVFDVPSKAGEGRKLTGFEGNGKERKFLQGFLNRGKAAKEEEGGDVKMEDV